VGSRVGLGWREWSGVKGRRERGQSLYNGMCQSCVAHTVAGTALPCAGQAAAALSLVAWGSADCCAARQQMPWRAAVLR
jgi:hypothetical protein